MAADLTPPLAQRMEDFPGPEELADEAVVLVVRGGVWRCVNAWQVRGSGDYFDAWHLLPSLPAPDPMTVLERHPMPALPNYHDEWVVIGYADGSVKPCRKTERAFDAECHRLWWCNLNVAATAIPEAGA